MLAFFRIPSMFGFASRNSLSFPCFALQVRETAELVPKFLRPPFCDFVNTVVSKKPRID